MDFTTEQLSNPYLIPACQSRDAGRPGCRRYLWNSQQDVLLLLGRIAFPPPSPGAGIGRSCAGLCPRLSRSSGYSGRAGR